jgi:meso-butanediol dehydrogenase/(S,S)-butanediol dehydrogenase/diacetyl reductase
MTSVSGQPRPHEEFLTLAGRSAVVTGAASGIGAASACELQAAGARVLGIDLHPGEEEVEILVHDLAETDALEDLASVVLNHLGDIDVLINCAGVSGRESVEELTWDSYERTLAVNLHAAVFLMSRLGRTMATRGYGRIVNVSSTHARISNPYHCAYAVSKAGLEAATRAFALEMGSNGVLVNAVAPGFVATGLNPVEKLRSDWFHSTFVKTGQVALGRFAEASEVAKLITFLASDANGYITGQSIVIDGGLSIRVPDTAI